ncbi:MAG: hypothetical protein ABI867_32965 [Kofleriaceae bacterium]
MGLLLEIVHDRRVGDAREAAALVRALGSERVRLTQARTRAWMLRDRTAILQVLEHVEPDAHTSIAFECITRAATLPGLADLVAADCGYLHIHGNHTTLRVWPRRDEAFLDDIVLGRDTAFARFRDDVADTWINGFAGEAGAAAIAALRRVLAEVDQPEVDFDLDLTVDAALALALAFPDAELEWSGGGVTVQLGDGELSTFHASPIPEAFETAWRARVAAALG